MIRNAAGMLLSVGTGVSAETEITGDLEMGYLYNGFPIATTLYVINKETGSRASGELTCDNSDIAITSGSGGYDGDFDISIPMDLGIYNGTFTFTPYNPKLEQGCTAEFSYRVVDTTTIVLNNNNFSVTEGQSLPEVYANVYRDYTYRQTNASGTLTCDNPDIVVEAPNNGVDGYFTITYPSSVGSYSGTLTFTSYTPLLELSSTAQFNCSITAVEVPTPPPTPTPTPTPTPS